MYKKNAFYWVTFKKNPYTPSMIHRPEGTGWTPEYQTVAQFNDPSHSHPWAVVGFDRAFKTDDFESIIGPTAAADMELPKKIAERFVGVVTHQMTQAERDVLQMLRRDGYLDAEYDESVNGGKVTAGERLK